MKENAQTSKRYQRGFEPGLSRLRVRHSTTEPPRSTRHGTKFVVDVLRELVVALQAERSADTGDTRYLPQALLHVLHVVIGYCAQCVIVLITSGYCGDSGDRNGLLEVFVDAGLIFEACDFEFTRIDRGFEQLLLEVVNVCKVQEVWEVKDSDARNMLK